MLPVNVLLGAPHIIQYNFLPGSIQPHTWLCSHERGRVALKRAEQARTEPRGLTHEGPRDHAEPQGR